jgi:hypothetical protein
LHLGVHLDAPADFIAYDDSLTTAALAEGIRVLTPR